MKAQIVLWHHSEKEKEGIKSINFEHNQILDQADTFQMFDEWIGEIVQKIYDVGLNVMVGHMQSNPEMIILGVSDDLSRTR